MQLITHLRTSMQQKPNRTTSENRNTWATFTFHSPIIRKITNLFKQTDLRIAYRSTNTIAQLMRRKGQHKDNNTDTNQDYTKSGIYKLTCTTCNKAYIGQTSRTITQRYREHIHYIKNNPQSAYAEHILRNIQEYGNLTETMQLLQPVQKMSMLLPYEQLFIQQFHQTDNLIPEQKCFDQNPLFKLAKSTGIT